MSFERVLSEVDKDLNNFYKVAQKVRYDHQGSLTLGKFVLTRLFDELVEDEFLNRKDTQDSRDLLKEKLKNMKILEVGEKSNIGIHFGSRDYFDDLYFLNKMMGEFSKEKNKNSLSENYDLIYLTQSLLPSKNLFYDLLQKKWDEEYNNEKESYWGTDVHAYDLLNKVRSATSLAGIIKKSSEYNQKTAKSVGLVNSEELKFFEKFKDGIEGCSDLHDIDYLEKLVSDNLKIGGVLIVYDAPYFIEIDNLKLFDESKYKESINRNMYTEKSKKIFKKIK